MQVAIVEDNPSYAHELKAYLKQYEAEYQTKIETECFSDGMKLVSPYRSVWDLILLDIEMPLLDGISTAKRIREHDTEVPIIFITNMAQYAIHGYEVGALDYVLKPISYYAFCLKMQKVQRLLRQRQGRSILIRSGGSQVRCAITDIRYIEVQNHNLLYHTTNGTLLGSAGISLNEVENQLEGMGFARCNICYLVNLRFVDRLDKDSVLVDGIPLKISRPKRKGFSEALMAFLGGGMG